MEFDCSNDILIDPDNLDQECLCHPGLFQKYSEACAKAEADMDLFKVDALKKAEMELEIISAEIELDIREHPEKYTSQKITEALVKALIRLDTKVQKAEYDYLARQKELIILKGKWLKLQSDVKSFQERSESLTNEVRLHGQGYFSAPEARPLAREWAKKQAQEDIADKAMKVFRKKKE